MLFYRMKWIELEFRYRKLTFTYDKNVIIKYEEIIGNALN